MAYKTLYNAKEYCYSELREARRIMATWPCTFEKGLLLMQGLPLILAYCPKEMIRQARGAIIECGRRVLYAVIGV